MGAGRTIKKLACAGFLVFLALGCRHQEFVPEAKFVDLYVELKLASAVYQGEPEKANETRRAILARYEVTPEEFTRRFNRLSLEPDAWKDFQEQVIRSMENFQIEPTKGVGDGI